MKQKTEIGEAAKALQHQLNEVKALIGEFEEKRAALGVCSVFPSSESAWIHDVLCRI